ncbi:MAG: TraR/DksA C4-type zinc finger protein [Verrucomicrobiae bacterium]|nr:TraR/DksA C4-type zinc finger protein [Verrucomicrobiae bacterium]MDW8344897.1 TraR/DksA C4-type zinc finger protein [Verrucomicrobiae bacterium]
MKSKKRVVNKSTKAKTVVKKKVAKAVKPARATRAAKEKPARRAVAAAPKRSATAGAETVAVRFSEAEREKFRKMLLDLRDHLIDGVNFLASDNLKRSTRDASGELSGYSMHMADAGTDNFDREFALSLVSNEQEALYEIQEALKRLDSGQYGICEMCEKPIPRERLEVLPFARRCIQCQSQVEKNRRFVPRQGPTFVESAEETEGEETEAEE